MSKKTKRQFSFRAQERLVPYVKPKTEPAEGDEPEPERPEPAECLLGFKLVYTPMDVVEAHALAEKANALASGLTLDEQARRLADLLMRVFSGWVGCTPEVVAELCPDFVGEAELQAMRDRLAEDGLEAYPFETGLLEALARHSIDFYWRAIQMIGEINDAVRGEDEARKNDSSSGASTEVPEGAAATPSG